MKVKVLGTGGAFDEMPTAFLVEDTILVDCGIEIAKKIIKNGEIQKIKTVAITHRHGDHIGGIELLFHYWNHVEKGKDKKLIYCSEDSYELIEKMAFEKSDRFEFYLFAKYRRETCFDLPGGMFLNVFPVEHIKGKVPSFGFTIGFNEKKYERGIAIFSGDTDYPLLLSSRIIEKLNAMVFHDMGMTGYKREPKRKDLAHPTEEEVFKQIGESKRVIGVHTNAELSIYRKAREDEIFQW